MLRPLKKLLASGMSADEILGNLQKIPCELQEFTRYFLRVDI